MNQRPSIAKGLSTGITVALVPTLYILNYLFGLIGQYEDASNAGGWVEEHTMLPDITDIFMVVMLIVGLAMIVWTLREHFKKDPQPPLPPIDEAQAAPNALPLSTITPPRSWYKKSRHKWKKRD